MFAELTRRAGAIVGQTFMVATPSGGEHRYYAVGEGLPARSTAGSPGCHLASLVLAEHRDRRDPITATCRGPSERPKDLW